MRVISAATRLAGVIGWPIGHSRSPELHNAAYAATDVDAVYLALPAPPERLASTLDALAAWNALGANVTVPHKAAVMALCAHVDPLAASVGAVNTIVFDDARRPQGYNTDVGGFADALAARGVTRGRAVVLGAGGAARAVVLALRQAGHRVAVVARDPDRGEALLGIGADEVLIWTAPSLADAVSGATLVIDATSADVAQDPIDRAFTVPVPIDALAADTLVVSLSYHRESQLLAAARTRGLPTMNGMAMLIHQAARAFTLMTGKPAPLAAMQAAVTSA